MRARSILLRVAVATSTIAALTLGAGLPAHAAPPELQVNDVTVVEGNAGTSFATFTIKYSGPGTAGVSRRLRHRRRDGHCGQRLHGHERHGCAAERRLQVHHRQRPDPRRHHRGGRRNLRGQPVEPGRQDDHGWTGDRHDHERRSPVGLDRRPHRRRERRDDDLHRVARRVIADRRGHDLRNRGRDGDGRLPTSPRRPARSRSPRVRPRARSTSRSSTTRSTRVTRPSR